MPWARTCGRSISKTGTISRPTIADGTPYPTLWKKLDLGANIQQGDIGDRGEQGLFETLGFELFNLAGVPGSATIPASLRIVEKASESGTSQYTTDFQGMYLMVEEPDGRYLDAHGLPDGNFYKMEGGSGTSKNQGPDATDAMAPTSLHSYRCSARTPASNG